MDRLAVCLPDLEEYRLTLGGVINTAYYPVVKLKPDGTTVWGERPEGMQWPVWSTFIRIVRNAKF